MFRLPLLDIKPWKVCSIDYPSFSKTDCREPSRKFNIPELEVYDTDYITEYFVPKDKWLHSNSRGSISFALYFTREKEEYVNTVKKLLNNNIPCMTGVVAKTYFTGNIYSQYLETTHDTLEIVEKADPNHVSLDYVDEQLCKLFPKYKLVEKYNPGQLMYAIYVCSTCLSDEKFELFHKLFN